MNDDQFGSSAEGAEFRDIAAERRRGAVGELWQFARRNKKWWLMPIVVALLLISLLVLAGSSSVGSLIYPLF